MAKVITSEAYTLIKQDIGKWLKNQAIFILPALLVFLVAVQQGADIKTASYAVYTWGLSAAIDLLRKYISKSRY